MKKTLARLLLAGAFALTLAPLADAKPFTARDMVTLDRLSDPRISPDGRWVIYARRVADYEANKAASELWLVDLRTGTDTTENRRWSTRYTFPNRGRTVVQSFIPDWISA